MKVRRTNQSQYWRTIRIGNLLPLCAQSRQTRLKTPNPLPLHQQPKRMPLLQKNVKSKVITTSRHALHLNASLGIRFELNCFRIASARLAVWVQSGQRRSITSSRRALEPVGSMSNCQRMLIYDRDRPITCSYGIFRSP